jgi:hypothetical protein
MKSMNGKMRIENQTKTSEKTQKRVYAQKPKLKCRSRIPSQGQ